MAVYGATELSQTFLYELAEANNELTFYCRVLIRYYIYSDKIIIKLFTVKATFIIIIKYKRLN
jgi:hypothetical protein